MFFKVDLKKKNEDGLIMTFERWVKDEDDLCIEDQDVYEGGLMMESEY